MHDRSMRQCPTFKGIAESKQIWFIFWMTLFLLEYSLFKNYAIREVVGKVPRHFDQSQYLNYVYYLYHCIVEGNYGRALQYGLQTGANGGLNLLNVFSLFILGYTRVGLLTINYICFFAAQITFFYVVSKISESKILGMGASGLLLAVQTTFMWAGDLLDYRWDFITFSLYSIWILFLGLGAYFESKTIKYVSAAVSGILIFVRPNVVIYVVGVVVLYELYNFFKKENRSVKERVAQLVQNVLIYGGICLLFGGSYIILNIKNFLGYYVGAYTGDMQELWQINGVMDNLLYYPRSLIKNHLGIALSIFLIVTVILFMFLVVTRKIVLTPSQKKTLYIIITSIAVPSIVLTLSANKNVLVISVIAGVCVFLMGFCIICIYLNSKTFLQNIMRLFAIVIFLSGIGNYALNCMHEKEGYTKEEQKGAIEISTSISRYIHDFEMEAVYIIRDKMLEDTIFNNNSIRIFSYENYGEYINIDDALGEAVSNNPMNTQLNEDMLKQGLEKTDFIIVAENGYGVLPSNPTDIFLDKGRELIWDYAEENLSVLTKTEWNGALVTVFVRETSDVRLFSWWKDWLGEKSTLCFNKNGEQEVLVIEGDSMYGNEQSQIICRDENKAELPVYTEVNKDNGKYRIQVDISELPQGQTELQQIFSELFVPRDVYGSTDDRELAATYPNEIYIE